MSVCAWCRVIGLTCQSGCIFFLAPSVSGMDAAI